MRLIDSHCHVQFNAYKDDMDEVIKRTLGKGVFMITVGTQKDTSQYGLDVAEKYDGVWATVGLHPNHLVRQSFQDEDEVVSAVHTREEKFDFDLFKSLATHPKCVAIGETGLDYYRIPETEDRKVVLEDQRQNVRAHFDLATQMNLPVSVHCRDAYQDQIELIAEYVNSGKLTKRGVIHCFSGSFQEAQEFIKIGFLIGIGGIVTFPPKKNNEGGLSDLQKTVCELPLEKIILETDAPYLSPVPERGERNEPWKVQFVAEKIAELKGLTVDVVAEETTKNVCELFEIKPEF